MASDVVKTPQDIPPLVKKWAVRMTPASRAAFLRHILVMFPSVPGVPTGIKADFIAALSQCGPGG